jgi:peptidoglycan glycosyltransferase
MATSCNIGMAFIGFQVGAARLFEYNSKFGFGHNFDLGIEDTLRKTSITIPVKVGTAPSGIKDRYEMAKYACGLSPDDRKDTYMMTPLQAALLSATIANDGVMMNPYIIKEIRNINGKLIYQSVPQEVKRPITAATAEKLTALMVNDVEYSKGTGIKARVKGLKVAGKTGTSGADVKGTLNAWFISFAPADRPDYAIAIVGDGEGKGMDVAAPIAADIYKSLLKY